MTAAQKHTDRIDTTRRKVVVGGVSALLAACTPQAPEPTQDPLQAMRVRAQKEPKANLYQTLRGFTLTGQDGKPVNIDALATANKDKIPTLTFSFSGCSNYCLANNPVLKQLDDKNDNLVHYVVAVNPSLDNLNDKTRAAFMETFTQVGVNPKKVVLLYPKSEEGAPAIVEKLKFLANYNGPDTHYASMVLYDKNGAYLDRKLALDALHDWSGPLQQEGKSR